MQSNSPLTFSIVNEINNKEYEPPSESYPVFVQQEKFTININSQLESYGRITPASFHEYCSQLKLWKQQLLQHVFTEYPDSLAIILQEETPIIIATDGTKSNQK